MSPRQVIVNLAGTKPIDDPEYRYKMPLVFGKIEGRGNGIKTVIPNISDVAMSLHRAPGEVNKFFGCELGAQTTYSAETDRAVVNGAHTDIALQNLMKRYIDKFVLCPGCGLPETEYKIKSGKEISHRCKACGFKGPVEMSHKLVTYILAQDKKAKKDGKGDKKKKSKEKDDNSDEGKKKKKKSKDKDSSEDDEKEKKKKKKKDKKEKVSDEKEKKKKKKKKDKLGDEKKDDSLERGMDDLSIEETDDATAMEMAVNETKKYLASNPSAPPSELLELVVNQQMASALKSFDKIHIFIRAAITPDFWEKKLVQKYAPTIILITNNNPIMGRHLISALEFVSLDAPKHFPVLLKLMFDEDALEEDVILEWASEGRTEYTLVKEEVRAELRGLAEPVVEWLEQDTDSDSDSD